MQKKEEKMKKTPKKPSALAVSVVRCVILAVVCGLVFTVLSGLMPIRIENPEQLSDLRFGFPVPFILQRYWGVLYEEWFPGYAPPQFGADGCQTELSAGGFLLSAGINSLAFALVFVSGMLLVRNSKKKENAENL